MSPEIIERLGPWTTPKQIVTSRGDRLLRTLPLTPDIERFYTLNLKALNGSGVVRSTFKGKRELTWWQEVPKAVVQAKQDRVAASRATDAEIDIPCPEGLSFKPYQRAGVAFCLEAFQKFSGALLADDMGLGKTVQAIGIINCEPKIQRTLIICPNSLKLNWHRELRRWLARPLSVGIADSKCFPSTDIVILNYESAYKFEKSLTFYWDLLICDEAHRIKNPKTRTTKSILGYRPTRDELKAGMEPSSGIPTRRFLPMTGTPIQNRPMEIFSLLNRIDPKRWKSRFEFGRRYCGGHPKFGGWDFSGASHTTELQQELRSTFMIRRLKSDVLKELPPKQRQVIVLPSDGLENLINEERKIDERWQAKLASIRSQNKNPQDYSEAVAQLTGSEIQGQAFKIAHEVALAKVPLVTEHVLEALDEGGKIVLFAHHLDVISAYVKAFKEYRPVRITGEDSIVTRQQSVDTFQRDDKCRIVVAGIQAAKEGLTLTASAHVIFGEIDWVPGTMCQCEDRCHRIGQAGSVLVQHLLLEGSVDIAKVQALVRKQEIIEGALDRRGENEQVSAGRKIVSRETIQPVRPTLPVKVDTDGQQLLLV